MRLRLAAYHLAVAWVLLWALALPAAAQSLGGPALKASAALSVDRVRPGDSFSLAVALDLPQGIHVNSNKPSEEYLIPTSVHVKAPAGLQAAAVQYPKPHARQLPFTKKPLSIYEGRVIFRVPLTVDETLAPGTLTLGGSVEAQPCSEQSCFPPQKLTFSVPVRVGKPGEAVEPVQSELFSAGPAGSSGVTSGGTGAPEAPAGAAPGGAGVPAPAGSRAAYPHLSRFAPPAEFIQWLERSRAGVGEQESGSLLKSLLLGGNWLLALPLIFLAGLALNLTPCVYPLIPITIGYFSRQSDGSKGYLLRLAALYVLGIAIMYSALGVVAALTKQLFGSQLQNPYVLAGFAAVMLALGLSMFGVWEFRLPAGLTNRVSSRAGLAGALIMGLLVGVVAAPCVGPAVVALLVVVGQLANPVLGFAVFFSLALGLGVPYLLLAVFSGLIRKLPRSGEWMDAIKHVFGLAMFWMALYYLGPIMGQAAYRVVIGLYTLAAGAYLLAFDASGRTARRFFAAKRGLGAATAFVAVWMILPHSKPADGLAFEPYSEQAIRQAQAEGRPVLIDFRADWCAECRQLEDTTFRDPKVISATQGMLLLRKDMTRADDPEAARLKQEYGIAGLPHLVVIPPSRAAQR